MDTVTKSSQNEAGAQRTQFEAEVADRMGLVPNFFRPEAAAFGAVRELWSFAKTAYLDNPLPPLFKERLFVHLSRFCRARYCIVRHVGFLVGKGHIAGTAEVPAQSVQDVIALLRYPGTEDGTLTKIIARVDAMTAGTIPPPGSPGEQDLFFLAGLVFIDPLRAERAQKALRTPLGPEGLEYLLAFLAFVRTAHFWTLTHPRIQPEGDILAFLEEHQALAELVLEDRDIASLPIGERLMQELDALRVERNEQEHANQQQALIINELNHRVKNMLAIVRSVVRQTLKRADVPGNVDEIIGDRLHAIAAAHDLLTKEDWNNVSLTQLVRESIRSFCPTSSQVTFEGPPVPLSAKTAVSFAMAIHELGTNAVKYGALSSAKGHINIEWSVREEAESPRLHFTWRETGGPPVAPPSHTGFGTFLIEKNLGAELEGNVDLRFDPTGLVCVIDSLIPAASADHR
ncbi:MAG: sensor histidine kinase [Alphaproteobacteria bacterium]